jgi:hypothetical protein
MTIQPLTGYLIKDAAELRKTVRRFKDDVNPPAVEARLGAAYGSCTNGKC